MTAMKLTENEKANMTDIVGKIMEYEEGAMSHEDMIVFFQELVDSGMAWTLQGSYGRMAQRLIEAGEVHPKVRAA